MKKPTKKQLQQQAEIKAARDAGRDFHRDHADDQLVEVHRWASRVYDTDGLGKELVLAFVDGFSQARLNRDIFLHEKKEAAE